MSITAEVVAEHGLTEEEYKKVLEILGREPNINELGIFSVMWSEHCSYKSSRLHLKKFMTDAPHVVLGPGENAGVVDIGDGQGIAFKMESHNHPSFIEPFQGAATGVGGILRDVFTMGARPICNLNLLRFGEADNPKTPFLIRGVSAGIAHYGNCMGIPTIAGETFFDASYNGNNLVNAMTLGLVENDKIFKGSASGVGNKIFYIGSKTGRDGIHGATMASESFGEGSEEKRPRVQVGNPFAEKVLLEAMLELMASGAVAGVQDMGAAGLTSSSIEMADRAGNGIRLIMDDVPQRETGMNTYEIMLSESQERMLVVITQGREEEVKKILEKWEIDAAAIGEVTDTGFIEVFEKGERTIHIPIAPLVSNAPVYDRPVKPYVSTERVEIPLNNTESLDEKIYRFIGSVNLCSKRNIYQQYDSMVGTATVNGPEQDAGIIHIHGTDKGVAVSVDCNSRYTQIDPYLGGKHTIAEAARNIVATGATPLAVTDCLNFGNPEVPEVMFQFTRSIDGMNEACIAFNTPVVSGNVSLYNETEGTGIFPTPAIGMVGLIKDCKKARKIYFTKPNESIYMTGQFPDTLDGSEYLSFFHKKLGSTIPAINLENEQKTLAFILDVIDKELLNGVHDISIGGLIKTLLTSLFTEKQQCGALLDNLPFNTHTIEGILFGENSGRFLFTVPQENEKEVTTSASEAGIPLHRIGTTTATPSVRIIKEGKELASINLKRAYDAWISGLNHLLSD